MKPRYPSDLLVHIRKDHRPFCRANPLLCHMVSEDDGIRRWQLGHKVCRYCVAELAKTQKALRRVKSRKRMEVKHYAATARFWKKEVGPGRVGYGGTVSGGLPSLGKRR